MSDYGWRVWGQTTIAMFVSLWLTKPIVTGFTVWQPTPMAHLVMGAISAVVWLSCFLGHRRSTSR